MQETQKSYWRQLWVHIKADIQKSVFPSVLEWLLFTAIPFAIFNLSPIPKTWGELCGRFMTDWLSANAVKLGIAAFVGLVLVFWRHLYRAQKKLYLDERERWTLLQEAIENLEDKNTMDFGDAVQHVIDNCKAGVGKGWSEIHDELLRLAREGTITITGKMKRLNDKVAESEGVAPNVFLLNAVYQQYGDFNDNWALVEYLPHDSTANKDGLLGTLFLSDENRVNRVLYYPRVNVAQLNRHFSGKGE